MRQTASWWPLALAVGVLGIFALVSPLPGCGSSSTPSIPDGDLDEEHEEESVGRCEDGAIGCSGTRAIICEDRNWVNLADCADEEMICERGRCVDAPDEDGDGDSDGDDSPDGDFDPPPDTTPPGIASTSPSNGAVNVPADLRRVLINFTEAIVPVGFVLRRDILLEGGCKPLTFSGQISAGNMQIDLTLLDYLENGRVYTVTMLPGRLADAAENLFEGYTFSFTVIGEVDGECEEDPTAPPAITHSYPYDGEMGVETDLGWVQIYFSKSLRITGWDAAQKVSVSGDDSHTVPFSFQWLSDNKNLSIRLLEDLHDDTTYTVSLAEGLRDNEDRELGAKSFWFSTSPPVEDGDVDPVDGDSDGDVEADTDTTPPNTGQIVRTYRTDCTAISGTPPAPALESQWLDSQTPGARKLRVIRKNLVADACLSGVNGSLTHTGHSLTIHETLNVPTPCEENCLRDVEYDIDYLMPAPYTVTLWPQGAETALTLEVPAP